MAEPDLIAAVATAQGIGAIGVVRISGPGLRSLMLPLLGREPAPRRALLANFLDDRRRAYRPGARDLLPWPPLLHRRGHARIAGAWRPGCSAAGAQALRGVGCPAGRAGGVYPPCISEWKAGSGAGRERCRSDRGALGGGGALSLAVLARRVLQGNPYACGGRDEAAPAGGSLHRFPGGGDRRAPSGRRAGGAEASDRSRRSRGSVPHAAAACSERGHESP